MIYAFLIKEFFKLLQEKFENLVKVLYLNYIFRNSNL